MKQGVRLGRFSLRTAIERISRGRSFKRRLPAEFGRLPLIVSPDAQLKVLKPGPEAFDLPLLQAVDWLVKPGDNVWDIGANLGVFSLAAAHRSQSGQILSIEADIWLCSLLRRTFRLRENSTFNAHVLPVAMSSTAGAALFSVAKRGRATNHFASLPGSGQTGGTRNLESVPTLPADSLLKTFEPPSVVKIDVEGAEVLVLEGMNDILRHVRPRVYCEVFSKTESQVHKIFSSHNYRISRSTGFNVFFDPL